MTRPNKVDLPEKPEFSLFMDEKKIESLAKPDAIFAVDKENTITIFGVIGDTPFEEGFTLNRMDAALRSIGNKPVTIYINSEGGSYYEGLGIYNRLLEHPAKITVKILGLAASAASVIAMAADEILIAKTASIMIHNAWIRILGNQHEMKKMAAFLEENIDAPMANVYAARTGKSLEDIKAYLRAETYFLGQDAIDNRFADGLLETAEVEACAAKGNPVRSAERLLTSGQSVSRSEARNLLNQIKGMPDAAQDTMQDAGDDLTPYLAELMETLRA